MVTKVEKNIDSSNINKGKENGGRKQEKMSKGNIGQESGDMGLILI